MAITPEIILNQKTSYSLNNFNIEDCQLGGPITGILYPIPNQILENRSSQQNPGRN